MAAKLRERKERQASLRADKRRLDFLSQWLKRGRWRSLIVVDKPMRYSLRDHGDNSHMDSGNLRAAIDVLMTKKRGGFA